MASVADATRREVLSVLRERGPLSTEELASAVAGAGTENEVDRDPESVRARLVHGHLPKLADVGLVEWDAEGETVETADHPVLQDPGFRELLAVDADDWDDVLGAISKRRRRTVLAVLADDDGLDRRELARRVAAREDGVSTGVVSEQRVEEVLATLYHAHLPKLERAGLVARDDDGASYAGHPDLEPEWFAVGPATVDR